MNTLTRQVPAIREKEVAHAEIKNQNQSQGDGVVVTRSEEVGEDKVKAAPQSTEPLLCDQGICFLDFDGVLNRITPYGYEPSHPRLRQENVECVAAFLQRFRLSVVVSSSWRQNYGLSRIAELLMASGGEVIAARLIGVTPLFEEQILRRSKEVAEHLTVCGTACPYVIVDDSKKHGFPAEHFVHTDGKMGFQESDAQRGAELLAAQGVFACK